jgi:hypothetical protein
MLSDSEFIKRLKQIFPSAMRHLDMLLLRHWSKKISNAENILNKSGKKFYSQNDEDGILLEILKRIKKNNGSFIEIGVGGFVTNNGTENNTIILLMLGWKGIWIDSQKIDINLNENSRLKFVKKFIDNDNCIKTLEGGLQKLNLKNKDINVISIDIDGNDFFIAETLLNNGYKPDCLIVEYNAKFPPPILYNMPYDINYIWKGRDDQGSSIQHWVNCLEKFGYKLICCNITGTNAFFINNKHSDRFSDIPIDINDIYYAPDYHQYTQVGHPTSTKTIEYFANKKIAKITKHFEIRDGIPKKTISADVRKM